MERTPPYYEEVRSVNEEFRTSSARPGQFMKPKEGNLEIMNSGSERLSCDLSPGCQLLVGAVWSTHADHSKSDTWVEGKELATYAITELGFLRVSTHPKSNVFARRPEDAKF